MYTSFWNVHWGRKFFPVLQIGTQRAAANWTLRRPVDWGFHMMLWSLFRCIFSRISIQNDLLPATKKMTNHLTLLLEKRKPYPTQVLLVRRGSSERHCICTRSNRTNHLFWRMKRPRWVWPRSVCTCSSGSLMRLDWTSRILLHVWVSVDAGVCSIAAWCSKMSRSIRFPIRRQKLSTESVEKNKNWKRIFSHCRPLQRSAWKWFRKHMIRCTMTDRTQTAARLFCI